VDAVKRGRLGGEEIVGDHESDGTELVLYNFHLYHLYQLHHLYRLDPLYQLYHL